MLLPLNTDAPIYHFPFATIGLIVVNIVCFIGTGLGSPERVEPWMLEWGNGLHPWQWISSNFAHGGFFHLFGNMIFLWGFGLVVEGKLGWWRFLVVYLGIGVVQCSIEQTVMLGLDRDEYVRERLEAVFGEEFARPRDDLPELPPETLEQLQGVEDLEDLQDLEDIEDIEGLENVSPDQLVEILAQQSQLAAIRAFADEMLIGSLGASAIIFGILAMSLVWAPKNEMTMFALVFIHPIQFEVTIMVFAAWYIGFEILIAVFSGGMGSSMMHTMGAGIGFGLGVILLKTKRVDCEDWDLFAVLSGKYGPHLCDRYGNRLDEEVRDSTEDDTEEDDDQRVSPVQPIVDLIEEGDCVTAAEELFNLRLSRPKASLRAEHLKTLALGLIKEGEFDDAEAYLEEYIATFPDDANWACLRLAGVFLQVQRRPRAALEMLRGIDKSSLAPKQREAFRKIAATAKQQVQAGVKDQEPEW